MLAIQRCAAQQCMVLASQSGTGSTNQHFCLEQGILFCPSKSGATTLVKSMWYTLKMFSPQPLFDDKVAPFPNLALPPYNVASKSRGTL